VNRSVNRDTSTLRAYGLRAIGLAVGVALLATTLARSDLQGASDVLAHVGVTGLLVLAPFLFAAVLHTLAWGRLFPGKMPRFGALFLVNITIEALLTSIPGGAVIAESSGPPLLRRRDGTPIADSVAALAAKKIAIVGSNAVYVALALVLGGRVVASASRAITGGLLFVWIATGASVVLFAFALGMRTALLHGSIAARLHGAIARLPSKRLALWIEAQRDGFTAADERLVRVLAAPRRLLIPGLLCLGGWFAEALETFLILRVLGATVTFETVIAIEVLASLLRSSAFLLPGGLGVQDAGYLALFAALSKTLAPDTFVVTAAIGVAFVLLKRLKETFWVATGYVALATAPRAIAQGVVP
jgi:hypothetical protein